MPTGEQLQFWKEELDRRSQRHDILPPNVIGVGAPRCGTRTLYGLLNRSADIYMSPVKEIGYFGTRLGRWTDREYLTFFDGGQGYTLRGEVTPSYLQESDAPGQIRRLSPDCKIIVQLRNPVRRALSHYRIRRQRVKLDDLDRFFANAMQWAKADFRPPDDRSLRGMARQYAIVLGSSFYHEALARYFATFGRDSIQVILLADIVLDFASTRATLCGWLGCNLPASPPRNFKQGALDAQPDDRLIDELHALFAEDLAATAALIGRPLEDFAL